MGEFVGIVVGLLIAAVFFILFTFVFRWIWNNVVPEVFGLKEITFGQAIGLLILASILFGSHRVVHIKSSPDISAVSQSK